MSRRKSREMAVQVLFHLDYNKTDVDTAFKAIIDEVPEEVSNAPSSSATVQYAQQLINCTIDHLQEIDELISDTSAEWKLDRMAGVDRNISRMAIAEIKYVDPEVSIPEWKNIVINEAIELAKTFGTEESSKFINGILGSLVKNHVI